MYGRASRPRSLCCTTYDLFYHRVLLVPKQTFKHVTIVRMTHDCNCWKTASCVLLPLCQELRIQDQERTASRVLLPLCQELRIQHRESSDTSAVTQERPKKNSGSGPSSCDCMLVWFSAGSGVRHIGGLYKAKTLLSVVVSLLCTRGIS